MMIFRGLTWVALALAAAEAARANVYTPITDNPYYVLVFDDEFNGTALDTTKWSVGIRQVDQTYPGGQGEQLASNVTVHNGVLDLEVTPGPTGDGYNYGTVGLTTLGSTIAGEPINVDNAYGVASGWWTDTAPRWNYPEADISEYWQAWSQGGADQTMNNYNDGCAWVLHNHYNYKSDLAAGYHVYGMLWTPTTITYYIDGVQTSRTTTKTKQTVPVWYGILNATVGGGGIFPNGTTLLANHMYVKYVHVYSAQAGAVAVTPEPGYGGPGAEK